MDFLLSLVPAGQKLNQPLTVFRECNYKIFFIFYFFRFTKRIGWMENKICWKKFLIKKNILCF